MSKGYTYVTKHTSPNKNKGRIGGKPTGITVHHWGGQGQKHANVVSWLTDKRAGTSAHYVASSGLVTCIVDPDDTAWHAGNRNANRRTIGIECRPEMSSGDFETVAQLIANLWKVYGKLPLYPHSRWTSTACPGKWGSELSRLRKRAEELLGGKASKPSAPAKPKPKPKPSSKLDEDGKLGEKTAKAYQKHFGSTQDGKLGHNSWKAGQRKLGTPADGKISKQSRTASSVGYAITQGWEYTGPNSSGSTFVRALQRLIGAKADGVWGPATTKALQVFLNKG
ncbi:N-acetylmuramoyl-L-alanine amidase CwlL-like [Tenebrio molitor]|uniref:N-acetylmuramoyl-L-alanine amidase CwlL-like n=1 Tax=Tenebrio molitor TaxID=7067 RepID=UPI0036247A9B